MLIENEIIMLKSFLVDLAKREATISSYNTEIEIIIKPSRPFIFKGVQATKSIKLDLWIKTNIEVSLIISIKRDFMFNPSQYLAIILYYRVVDAITQKIST